MSKCPNGPFQAYYASAPRATLLSDTILFFKRDSPILCLILYWRRWMVRRSLEGSWEWDVNIALISDATRKDQALWCRFLAGRQGSRTSTDWCPEHSRGWQECVTLWIEGTDGLSAGIAGCSLLLSSMTGISLSVKLSIEHRSIVK